MLRFELRCPVRRTKAVFVPSAVGVCRKTLQSQPGTSLRLGAPSKSCMFVMEDNLFLRETPVKILAGQG